MTIIANAPFPTFLNLDGAPLEDGYLYFGYSNQNPETNPITVYWDGDFTTPAAQPIRTSGGYPIRDGSPANMFVSATDYSITVRDKNRRLVYSNLFCDLSGVGVSQLAVADIFTGDGTTTVYTLSDTPASLSGLDVSIGGVTQLPGVDYTLINGTDQLTFTSPPPSGVSILVRFGRANEALAQISYTTQPVTATAGQTLFNLNNAYTPGANTLAVYLNGLRLRVGFDYTETSTTQITLTAGAVAGDELLFVTGSTEINPVAVTASSVAYTPAGTGAVATDVQSKLRESVSVKDFGAVGDGVTDESAKVQLAINSISSTGGFVLVNRGVVYNQASLTIPLDVVLVDEANSRFVFAHTAIKPGVLDSHLTFKDIRPNNATRVYVEPNGEVSSGTLSALKLFGTDYTADQTNYQDFGIYLSRKVATVSSVDTAGDTVTSNAHGFGNGDLVRYETTGTAIGGLTANAAYYVVSATTNTFSLASLAAGTAINLTSAGTGTHSFTQTTSYINGKVNGTYPTFSIAHSFQDGAQVGLQEFPINTGPGQAMHVALGGSKPSRSVWYSGVRVHVVSDVLFNNNQVLRWMNAAGDSAGYGVRVNSSNDLDFLSNSTVYASFLFNGGAIAFKLYTAFAHNRVSGTAGSTTPNVAQISFLQIPSNASPYTITDFINGIEGQELTILFSDGNATVQRSATLRLSGGVNFTGTNGAILTLIKGSSGWFEKCRSVNP